MLRPRYHASHPSNLPDLKAAGFQLLGINNLMRLYSASRPLSKLCRRQRDSQPTPVPATPTHSNTWEAFRLLAVEELSGAPAAERLRMKVATAASLVAAIRQPAWNELSAEEKAAVLRGLDSGAFWTPPPDLSKIRNATMLPQSAASSNKTPASSTAVTRTYISIPATIRRI